MCIRDSYMTVSSLGLISTKTILIIFVAVNTYNMIIARTFIENYIPEDLYEEMCIRDRMRIG